MNDQPDDRMTGWNALTRDELIDLCEAAKTWVKDGPLQVWMEDNLCKGFDTCCECPAGKVRFTNRMDMCSALMKKYITLDDALELVEHEMEKRGMMKYAR